MKERSIKGLKSCSGDTGFNDQTPGTRSAVKFEIFGEEMIVKMVKPGGCSGKIYLPSHWVGHRVKIVKTEEFE
jgi:putative transposon-encoded protein